MARSTDSEAVFTGFSGEEGQRIRDDIEKLLSKRDAEKLQICEQKTTKGAFFIQSPFSLSDM